MTSTAIVGEEGALTLPADVANALNVRAGDRIEFVEVDRGHFVVVALNRSVTELKGMFGVPLRSASIDDMNRAIARQATRGVRRR